MAFIFDPFVLLILSGVVAGFIVLLIIKGTRTTTETGHNGKEYGAKRIIPISLFILSGIPLCIYPFVMIANLMQLAGEWAGNESVSSIIVICLFILATSLYPVTYFLSIFLYRESGKKLFPATIPLIHIFIVVVLFYIARIIS